jgi:hypothetical protein
VALRRTILKQQRMKLVKVEDLNVGDEIIISCQSCFKYLRILRKPMVSKKKHWRTGATIYKLVKCSIRRETKPYYYLHNGVTHTREYKDWGFGPEDHNYEHYVNLNDRNIILVNKEN